MKLNKYAPLTTKISFTDYFTQTAFMDVEKQALYM